MGISTRKIDIITNMCLTYDHRYYLPAKDEGDDNVFNAAMTVKEKEFVYRQMLQLFENDIQPILEAHGWKDNIGDDINPLNYHLQVRP